MTMSSPTEQLVEDIASVYFGAIGVAVKRGVEIDDAKIGVEVILQPDPLPNRSQVVAEGESSRGLHPRQHARLWLHAARSRGRRIGCRCYCRHVQGGSGRSE